MHVIALPGLPRFPPSTMGPQLDQRLRRMADMERLPTPLIASYDSHGAGTVRALLAPLADPLTAHIEGHLSRPAFKQRSALEARIADALDPISRATLSDQAAWQARLHDIAYRVHGYETRLRTSAIGTEPGFGGNIMAYPPADRVRPSLRMISQEVSRHRAAALSEVAAYLMLACTTVHPFIDGNGRIARIMFNLVLRSEFPNLPYIAIKEITQFSQADFLIAINRVHFRKDWEPYFRWLLAILDIHLVIGAGASDAAA